MLIGSANGWDSCQSPDQSAIFAERHNGAHLTANRPLLFVAIPGALDNSVTSQLTQDTNMKTTVRPLLITLLAFSIFSAHAQPGLGAPKGPQFSGSLTKLFGDNTAFSAALEMQTKDGNTEIVVPGKLSFDKGKSRFEMDITQIKGGKIPAGAAEQMKAMGMDTLVAISRPDKKLNYLIYSGLSAYIESESKDAESTDAAGKYKVETTEVGQETLDGQPCVKNKIVVTDEKGKTHESLVWNATDLKQFPIKIETAEDGTKITMFFKDIKLAKPDDAIFAPPASFKKYDNMMALMQQEIMKRVGGAGGPP